MSVIHSGSVFIHKHRRKEEKGRTLEKCNVIELLLKPEERKVTAELWWESSLVLPDGIHPQTGSEGQHSTAMYFICLQDVVAWCMGPEVFLAVKRWTASSAKTDNKAERRAMPNCWGNSEQRLIFPK